MTFTKKNSCKGNLSKKKFLQAVMPKKKIRATEVTCIALKGSVKKNKLKKEYCNTLHFIATTAV